MTKRVERGFMLGELAAVSTMGVVLLAVGNASYQQFQARSKQAEAKMNLRALATAEIAYFDEYDEYTVCIGNMGFNPERGNRYRYDIGTTRPKAQSACNTQQSRETPEALSNWTDNGVLVDVFQHPNGAVAKAPTVKYQPIPPEGQNTRVAKNLVGVTPLEGGPTSSFGATATGNIDSDKNLDVWYVSSVPSTTSGVCPKLKKDDQEVGPRVPKNIYNDGVCP